MGNSCGCKETSFSEMDDLKRPFFKGFKDGAFEG